MTASIDPPTTRGQFLDRFLAFFAGAAIAVWFLGGLSSSTTESASLAGPETQVVAALTSESTTILTRMSEELIVQVAATFEASPESAPFATIGEDGQVRILSIEALTELSFISPGSSSPSSSGRFQVTGQVATRYSDPELELVASGSKALPKLDHTLSIVRQAKFGSLDGGSQSSAFKQCKAHQRDGPKRSHPLLA